MWIGIFVIYSWSNCIKTGIWFITKYSLFRYQHCTISRKCIVVFWFVNLFVLCWLHKQHSFKGPCEKLWQGEVWVCGFQMICLGGQLCIVFVWKTQRQKMPSKFAELSSFHLRFYKEVFQSETILKCIWKKWRASR